MDLIVHLLAMVRALATDRARLARENVALRQQLLVLKRTVKRARLNDSDRAFWLLMRRMLRDWKGLGARIIPSQARFRRIRNDAGQEADSCPASDHGSTRSTRPNTG